MSKSIHHIMKNPAPASRVLFLALCLASPLAALAKTVAYYRFETGVAGQSLGRTPHLVLDSSDNKFDANPSNPLCSSDVPVSAVPGTGAINAGSLQFQGKEEVYSPPGEGLSSIAFTDFTLELWVRFNAIEGWQTLVGRDDTGNPGEGIGQESLFYLTKIGDINPHPGMIENGLRVQVVTRENQILDFNSFFQMTTQKWYHVAVVGDTAAGTLTLFVDGKEVGGTSGFTGLFAPIGATAWTFGRGHFRGKLVDFFYGNLDEVRFSNTALPPGLFLNAKTPAAR